jgi:hypothetical protein
MGLLNLMARTQPALGAFVLSLCLATAAVVRAASGPGEAWVQLSERGAEARVVTTASQCPEAVVDGQPLPMRIRARPTAQFPVTVCELQLPAGARHASIGAQDLVLPRPDPQRILIFGDTGCRMKGLAIQKCDDPHAWPFAEVARLAAAHHPDLVIHVGDYYYRETPCPAGDDGCKSSPWGDNWTTWDADFFTPAAPLLRSAPWVMARGNHESCLRGGPGWFRLLDAGATPLACPAVSAPYAVNIGPLNLYVIDTADAVDRATPPDAVARLTAQLDALRSALATHPGWIVTHRPVWAMAPVFTVGPFGPVEVPLDLTEQAALRGRDLSAVQMIVSGHVHHFASFDFGPARPPQLIVGTGGDIPDPGDTPRFRTERVNLDGLSAAGFAFQAYGFLLLERDGKAWNGAFYDLGDHVIARCRLAGRSLACARA